MTILVTGGAGFIGSEQTPPGLSLRSFATPQGGSCCGPAKPVPRKALITAFEV
jgi:hypothetical protein